MQTFFSILLIYNNSLRMAFVPSSYKETNVSPVPKKSNLSLVTNYRPISLLNSEAKVFVRLILHHLYKHIRDNNLSAYKWFRTGINVIRKLKLNLDRKSLETIKIYFIRLLLEYGDVIRDNCTKYTWHDSIAKYIACVSRNAGLLLRALCLHYSHCCI